MAFSAAEKIAIAKKMAEGKKAPTIAKELKLPRSSVSAFISSPDEELQSLLNEFGAILDDYKKREVSKAISSLKDLYTYRVDSLLATWCELVDLSEEDIKGASVRDRVGAAKLILEMVENLADRADEEVKDDNATEIEIIVEDASKDE